MVNRRQTSGQVIRRLVGRRGRDAKANVLRHSRHGRDDSQRLVDRPLGARHNGRVQVPGALVDIVAPEHIGNEDPVELGGLEQLGQLGPVVDIIKAPGLVVGMLPQPGRLVATAHLNKRIEDKRLGRRHRID